MLNRLEVSIKKTFKCLLLWALPIQKTDFSYFSILAFICLSIFHRKKKICNMRRERAHRITSLFCTALQHLWPLWRHGTLDDSTYRVSGVPGGWSFHQRQNSPLRPAALAAAGWQHCFLHKPPVQPAVAARRTRERQSDISTTKNDLIIWTFCLYFNR